MTTSFKPIEPIKDRSNLWRNFISLFSILLVVGILAALRFVDFGSDVQSLSFNSLSLVEKAVTDIPSVEGGDLVIQPPAPTKPQLPELQGEMIPSDKFSAVSMIVKDNETGMVLFKKDEYKKYPIASITKLVSSLVLLEKSLDWATSTQVVKDDIIDTHMYAGDTYTLEELWLAALVGSSNKAILTLADAAGWPREAFVERMNQKARELGMVDTHFVEPTGLDEENISTASDIVLLLDEALQQEKISQALLTKEHNLYSKERKKKHHMWNTNWILLGWVNNDFFDLRGGKTGYIPASGYNFIMQVGDGSGSLIDVVVLGANSHEARFTEARDIANWVFDNYKWPAE